MRQLVILATLVSAILAAPLAGTAVAGQPENVATHVTFNHESGVQGASGNPRSSSGPGYALGKFTPCVILVLEDKENRPACRPEFQ